MVTSDTFVKINKQKADKVRQETGVKGKVQRINMTTKEQNGLQQRKELEQQEKKKKNEYDYEDYGLRQFVGLSRTNHYKLKGCCL